jgi:hypothetical protein
VQADAIAGTVVLVTGGWLCADANRLVTGNVTRLR